MFKINIKQSSSSSSSSSSSNDNIQIIIITIVERRTYYIFLDFLYVKLVGCGLATTFIMVGYEQYCIKMCRGNTIAYRILVHKPVQKNPLRRPRKCRDNIKLDIMRYSL